MERAKEILESLDKLSKGRHWALDDVFPALIDALNSAKEALDEIEEAEIINAGNMYKLEALEQENEDLREKLELLEGSE